MELAIKLTDIKVNDSALKQKCLQALEVAAIRGREEMVERLPAAGQTPYSTGQLRQSIRFEKTGEAEHSYSVPMGYGIFVEFGTGPKGARTGAVPEFPNDPQPGMSYHGGEVLVTRWGGRLLETPIIRHTQGMEAQPFLRPALVYATELLRELLAKMQLRKKQE